MSGATFSEGFVVRLTSISPAFIIGRIGPPSTGETTPVTLSDTDSWSLELIYIVDMWLAIPGKYNRI